MANPIINQVDPTYFTEHSNLYIFFCFNQMHDIYETNGKKQSVNHIYQSSINVRYMHSTTLFLGQFFFILRCVKVFLTSIWDKLYLAVTLYFRLEPHHAFYETNARILLCLSSYISSCLRIRNSSRKVEFNIKIIASL